MADTNRPPSFPAGLAGVLNSPEDNRDSAYGSLGGSKHNSVQSALTPPLSGYQSSTEKTPSPINTCISSHPLHSPGGMSVASIISPTTESYTPRSADRQSGDPTSRRESVTSQLGPHMSDLRLANSPYASANQSTTSLQSSLQQQRNPHNADRTSGSRFSNGYQPSSQRLPEPMSPKVSRTAPAITGPELGNIARAPEPTKGQAWAFPEEVVQRLPSAARPGSESVNRQGTSFLDSRRSSLAESVSSSQFTTESVLPLGQRRLEDGMPPDYQRLSRASSELQGVTTSHHHHSLQHKTLNDLQSDAGSPSSSSQPYSRTPELRVSHKLAERKRRTEMKDLFDNLRDMMPQERGSKASKWEILTKAIHEYSRLQDEIRKSNHALAITKQELDASRHENSTIRLENAQLREQNKQLLAQSGQQPIRHHVSQNTSFAPPQPSEYAALGPPGGQLPPIRLDNSMRDPNSMNGIQYHGDGPSVNGYEHRF